MATRLPSITSSAKSKSKCSPYGMAQRGWLKVKFVYYTTKNTLKDRQDGECRMWEISKSFGFEAAHTLRRDIETESSQRIHGHSYKVVVTVGGTPDKQTGMVMDIGQLELQLATIRTALDHRFLDEIADLGPATMENIATWIWRQLADVSGLIRVEVLRESCGERCAYTGS